MIGQKSIIEFINNIPDGKFPRFSIVCGPSGCGKTTLIKYINDTKIHAEYNECKTMDDVRQVCLDAPNYQSNRLYVLSGFSGLNFRTKEAILKLCEDIPQNLYIIIETNSVSDIKQTLLSRANLINMSAYSRTDLYNFCLTLENATETELNYLLDSFKTPGDILRAHNVGISSLYSFCVKVLNNIFTAHTFNCMKIADSLKLKSDGAGYDLDLFFTVLSNAALNYLQPDSAYLIIKANSNVLNKLSVSAANKLALFDSWLFEIRGVTCKLGS